MLLDHVSDRQHFGGRRSLAGSMIGSIGETQEMLNFSGAHNITSDIEVIDIKQVNEA
jgi:uncharacterized zinc-type alcohol dehydrogenase-like protein